MTNLLLQNLDDSAPETQAQQAVFNPLNLTPGYTWFPTPHPRQPQRLLDNQKRLEHLAQIQKKMEVTKYLPKDVLDVREETPMQVQHQMWDKTHLHYKHHPILPQLLKVLPLQQQVKEVNQKAVVLETHQTLKLNEKKSFPKQLCLLRICLFQWMMRV
jgi:hypothetical protein